MSVVPLPRGVGVDSPAVHLSLREFAFVAATVEPGENATTMLLAVDELAFVPSAVDRCQHTSPGEASRDKVAFVAPATGKCCDPAPLTFSGDEIALVPRPVGAHHDAMTVELTGVELPLVSFTARPHVRSGSVPSPADELTLIPVAIRLLVDPAAVWPPIGNVAFVSVHVPARAPFRDPVADGTTIGATSTRPGHEVSGLIGFAKQSTSCARVDEPAGAPGFSARRLRRCRAVPIAESRSGRQDAPHAEHETARESPTPTTQRRGSVGTVHTDPHGKRPIGRVTGDLSPSTRSSRRRSSLRRKSDSVLSAPCQSAGETEYRLAALAGVPPRRCADCVRQLKHFRVDRCIWSRRCSTTG